MSMNNKEIQKKYQKSKSEMFLHYTVLGGELPLELIKELDIGSNTQHYITGKGKYKGWFIYKRAGNLIGYQLSRASMIELSQEEPIYAKYLPLNSRRTTNDISRRTKMRSRAKLFYFLDKASIEYLEKPKEKRQTYFYDSRFIKRNIETNEKKHNILSSRAFGTIRCEGKEYYTTYVFDDKVIELRYNIEHRNIIASEKMFNTEKSKVIILVRDKEIQTFLIEGIVKAYVDENPKKLESVFKIYNDIEFNEINILTLDNVGVKQMHFLKNRNVVEKIIKRESGCASESEVQRLNEKDGIECDSRITGIPCLFLYSLDADKIRRAYNELISREYVAFYIICFKEHESIITKIFDKVSNYVTVFTFEEYEIEKKLDIVMKKLEEKRTGTETK